MGMCRGKRTLRWGVGGWVLSFHLVSSKDGTQGLKLGSKYLSH